MIPPIIGPSNQVEETDIESLEKLSGLYLSQMHFFQTQYYMTLGRIEEIKSGTE